MWAAVVALALAPGCALAGAAQADTAAGLRDFQEGRFGEAHQAWRDAAQAGEADAALFLGVQYDVGAGVAADPAQARHWYGVAAGLGSAPAMFNLAVIYDSGRMVPRDPAMAIRLYERAAQFRHARAEFNLGLIFEAGDGVERDIAAARRWFGRAYGDGIPAAQAHLVRLGAPVPRPLAAPGGHADDGMEKFKQAQSILLGRSQGDRRRAVQLFRDAAATNALAAYDLAYCYENAIGTPRDLVEALRWYRRAMAQARDDELRQMAGRNAELVAARMPDPARGMAEAGH